MSPVLEAIGRPLRDHGPRLLAGLDQPHDELLVLVWGPRFDREHALALWARFSHCHPDEAGLTLPAILTAADRFDGLDAAGQQRLRRLIQRHRTRNAPASALM